MISGHIYVIGQRNGLTLNFMCLQYRVHSHYYITYIWLDVCVCVCVCVCMCVCVCVCVCVRNMGIVV